MLEQTQTIPQMSSSASQKVTELIETRPITEGIPENELESYFTAPQKHQRRSRNVKSLAKMKREEGNLNGEADEVAVLGQHREAPRTMKC